MNIPTVIFINKIDQAGVDLQSVVQSVRDKLSADIIIKQTVSLSPEIVLEENTDIEAWDAVIENNDKLLKSISQENQSAEKNLCGREQRQVQDASCSGLLWQRRGAALAFSKVMDAVTGLFNRLGNRGAPPYAAFFKVEYTDCGQRRVSIYGYTANALRLRIRWPWPGEKLKITEMRIPSKGGCSDQTPLIRAKLLSFPATA